ncbi:unnamed protein product [Peniophora sp. CBMAI 1063]|nr:unnamed protein product [Peniophora sp. CBMAI 1063]
MNSTSFLASVLDGIDLALVLRRRLTECLEDVMMGIPLRMSTTEFEELATSLDPLWDAMWNHQAGWDVQTLSKTAVGFVQCCSAARYFRPWGSSHLPHVLLYAAVNVKDIAIATSLVHELHTLMGKSLSTPPAPLIVAYMHEVSDAIDISSIVSLLLDVLGNAASVGGQLHSAIEIVGILCAKASLLDHVPGHDIFDTLDVAVKRSYQGGSPRTRASILHAYCEFVLGALRLARMKYSDALLSGRYDIFTALADGLVIYTGLDAVEKADPKKMYKVFAILLLVLLKAALGDDPAAPTLSVAVPRAADKFILDMRTTAAAKMGALIKAVRDTPSSKIGSSEGVKMWHVTLTNLVRFSLGIGAHPFCARSSCKYTLRHLPKGRAFKKCGGCIIARYCSTECQKADRKAHKANCGRNLKEG